MQEDASCRDGLSKNGESHGKDTDNGMERGIGFCLRSEIPQVTAK